MQRQMKERMRESEGDEEASMVLATHIHTDKHKTVLFHTYAHAFTYTQCHIYSFDTLSQTHTHTYPSCLRLKDRHFTTHWAPFPSRPVERGRQREERASSFGFPARNF